MRSKQEIRRIVEGFATSGKARREYCAEHGISISTLDYWRRRHKPKPKLMEVAIEPQQPGPGFALVLANGRRIESSWKFSEAEAASVDSRGRGVRRVRIGTGDEDLCRYRSRGHAQRVRGFVRAGARSAWPRSAERVSVLVFQPHAHAFEALEWDGSGLWVCAKRLEKGRSAGRKQKRNNAALLCEPRSWRCW
jgi:hypothetical protein